MTPPPDPTCPACGYILDRHELAAALGAGTAAKGGRAATAALTPEQLSERGRRGGAASGAARRAARAAKPREPKA